MEYSRNAEEERGIAKDNISRMKKRIVKYFKEGLDKEAILYILFKEYNYGKINNEEADELIKYLDKFDFPLGIIPKEK